jgi:hypothetical protein
VACASEHGRTNIHIQIHDVVDGQQRTDDALQTSLAPSIFVTETHCAALAHGRRTCHTLVRQSTGCQWRLGAVAPWFPRRWCLDVMHLNAVGCHIRY